MPVRGEQNTKSGDVIVEEEFLPYNPFLANFCFSRNRHIYSWENIDCFINAVKEEIQM